MKEKITRRIIENREPETMLGAEAFSVRSIGIIGHGDFGQLLETLVGRFMPETRVKIYSPERQSDAKRFFQLERVAKCEAVVLAVPIRNIEEALVDLLPYLHPDTVLINIATIQRYTSEVIKRLVPEQPCISMHPWFGPDTYGQCKGNVSGLRIFATGHNLVEETYEAVSKKLQSFGFDIQHISAEEHDKLVAEELFHKHVTRKGVHRDHKLFLNVYRFDKKNCDVVLEGLRETGLQIRNELEKELADENQMS